MKTGDGNTEEREAAATGDRDAVRGQAGAAGASAAKNRRIRESYDLIEDLYCGDNGRPCCDPVVLFKLMLIQYISKAPPHNSAMRQAMPFPPSAACKFLDLPPVNPRNLHLHLTKNPFAGRPPHLCGVALGEFQLRAQAATTAAQRPGSWEEGSGSCYPDFESLPDSKSSDQARQQVGQGPALAATGKLGRTKE